MGQSRLVSIIILNLNGRLHLKKCLESLAQIDYPNYEIILVDQGSNDDSIKFVKENYPQVKIIQSAENLGFAKGNNLGCQNAKGEYLLFLNNDTAVKADFLSILVEEAEKNPQIGALSPQILQLNAPTRLDCVGAFLTNSGFLYHFGFGKKANNPKYQEKLAIFSVKGAAFFCRQSALQKTGLFDEDFFLYFEETDLCHRLWLCGFQIFYLPKSQVWHWGAATSQNFNNSFLQFHSFKNRILSLIKNLGVWELLKILPLHLFLCQVTALGWLIVKRDLGLYFAIEKAFVWNFLNLSKTLKKRKRIQKEIRQVSDRLLMPQIKKAPKLSYYYHLFFGLQNYVD